MLDGRSSGNSLQRRLQQVHFSFRWADKGDSLISVAGHFTHELLLVLVLQGMTCDRPSLKIDHFDQGKCRHASSRLECDGKPVGVNPDAAADQTVTARIHPKTANDFALR